MTMVRMEYVGPIPELQGHTALVRKHERTPDEFLLWNKPLVLAQFDNVDLEFNGRRMAFGWAPFTPEQFRAVNGKPIF
jgi:hypothetical protein